MKGETEKMKDPTETVRRALVPIVNATPDDGIEGPRWSTDTLQRDFEVTGFAAPFVVVQRKADGVKGTLMFRHNPRVYWNFEPA
jgi:hypothetical protein